MYIEIYVYIYVWDCTGWLVHWNICVGLYIGLGLWVNILTCTCKSVYWNVCMIFVLFVTGNCPSLVFLFYCNTYRRDIYSKIFVKYVQVSRIGGVNVKLKIYF